MWGIVIWGAWGNRVGTGMGSFSVAKRGIGSFRFQLDSSRCPGRSKALIQDCCHTDSNNFKRPAPQTNLFVVANTSKHIIHFSSKGVSCKPSGPFSTC
eukprot:gene19717-biopygen6264